MAQLPNGGADRLAVFEAIVRRLRTNGTEVLLLTDNAEAQSGKQDALWTDGEFVRQLADRYGCALADTAALMLEATQRGQTVYSDRIHQNANGHRQWAEAIAAVLAPDITLPATSAIAAADISDPAHINTLPTLQPAQLLPRRVELDFSPKRKGGIPVNTPVPQNRLAVYWGINDGVRTDFSAGDTLILSHPRMCATDIVFDASSGFTLEIRETGKPGAPPIRQLTYEAPAGSPAWSVRPQVRTLFAASQLLTPANRSYELTVIRGTLRLYAAQYYTPSP